MLRKLARTACAQVCFNASSNTRTHIGISVKIRIHINISAAIPVGIAVSLNTRINNNYPDEVPHHSIVNRCCEDFLRYLVHN